jgi:hypothetical protein
MRGWGCGKSGSGKRASVSVQRLRSDGSGCDEFRRSALLPQLDLAVLAEHVLPQDEPQALRAFRNLIQVPIQA